MTGSTVAPAAPGVLAVAAVADDDEVAAGGDGVATCGGAATPHCASTRHAASIPATAAPRRSTCVNWDAMFTACFFQPCEPAVTLRLVCCHGPCKISVFG
ncbi:hypothetical protein BRW65_05405 [Mycobacterium paraffinicum]|uniref:Uncharacterized protein n=1 Tax=Mycobacterium paraffinicum TaxID=53378 RepID=A0A1Q4HZX2_9MYCO|nr:hypothetical protein BRW65_05405 [Mycobacterium paraffinicum]